MQLPPSGRAVLIQTFAKAREHVGMGQLTQQRNLRQDPLARC